MCLHDIVGCGLIRRVSSVQNIPTKKVLVFNLKGIPAARLAELRSACGVRRT